MDHKALFVFPHLDEEAIRSAIDVPVDISEVVSDSIFPVVGELDRRTALTAATTTEACPLLAPGDNLEAFEAAQKRVIKDRRSLRLYPQTGGGSGRFVLRI
jgi:hypothetical protein